MFLCVGHNSGPGLSFTTPSLAVASYRWLFSEPAACLRCPQRQPTGPAIPLGKTSQGADGIRVADVNGDGRLDIAIGWEESGVVRIYVCPESDFVRKPWAMTEGWYRGRSRGCRLCRCRWIFGRSQLL